MTDSFEEASWRKHVTETGARRLKKLMGQIPNPTTQKHFDMEAVEHLKRYTLDEGGKVWCPFCHKLHILHYWDEAKEFPKNVIFEYHPAETKEWVAESSKRECFFCRQKRMLSQIDPFLTERLNAWSPLGRFVCKECAKDSAIEIRVNEIASHELLNLGGQ